MYPVNLREAVFQIRTARICNNCIYPFLSPHKNIIVDPYPARDPNFYT